MLTVHLALTLALLFSYPSVARAAELVHADGRHVSVRDPRADASGRWTAEIEGRRTIVRPGEVVVIVDDSGMETVIVPALAEAPLAAAEAALIESLRSAPGDAWRTIAMELSKKPTRGLLDALVKLAGDSKKEVRRRAIGSLALLYTKESTRALAEAVLAEKDASLRGEVASTLYSVCEIYARADLDDVTKRGIASKDSALRIAFAIVAPKTNEAATKVLRDEGLTHADHHVREQAALELGNRGDAASEKLLISMLTRKQLSGVDDAALERRLYEAEQIDVCRALGVIGTLGAVEALKKAEQSSLASVARAAKAALAKLKTP